MPTKIAIIGAGFGGIYTLLSLQQKLTRDCEIIIFNKSSDFIFTPLLHEAATGGVNISNIIVPIRSFIKSGLVTFINDTVIEIALDTKSVKTTTCSFTFDYLVLATGSETNTFNIEGVVEHCLFLKTVKDALAIKRKIISSIESYYTTKDITYLTFTLVGAGSTGVELTLEIDEFIKDTLSKHYNDPELLKNLRITLICSNSQVLFRYDPYVQKKATAKLAKRKINLILNTSVIRVSKDSLVLSDGSLISSRTIIWCGGVKPVSPVIESALPVFGAKALSLNPDLTVGSYTTVFALGDVANYKNKLPLDAQVAVLQAEVVAANICNSRNNKKTIPFVFKSKGNFVSLGRWDAAGVILGFKVSGPVAWWIWRTIYLSKLPTISKKLKTALDWTLSIFSQKDMSNF